MNKYQVKIKRFTTQYRSQLTYLSVGCLLFAVDFSCSLLAYYSFEIDAGYASAIGFVMSFLIGFTLNKNIVFRHDSLSRFNVNTQVALYLVLAMVNLFVSAYVVDISVAQGIRIEVIKPIVVLTIAYNNYYILGRFIFSKKPTHKVK